MSVSTLHPLRDSGQGLSTGKTHRLCRKQQWIRLSREVLDHLRASGPGWQSRLDETLREAIKAGRL